MIKSEKITQYANTRYGLNVNGPYVKARGLLLRRVPRRTRAPRTDPTTVLSGAQEDVNARQRINVMFVRVIVLAASRRKRMNVTQVTINPQ